MVSDAVWRPYHRQNADPAPLVVTGAKASRLHLADGRILIDGAAGWWDACHGYNHPYIQDAIARQLRAMPHVLYKGLTHEPAEILAERLVGRVAGPLNHVFFSETAAGAVEAATTMALSYWLRRGAADRRRFLILGDGVDPHPVSDTARSGAVRLATPSDPQTLQTFQRILERQGSRVAGVIFEPLIDRTDGLRLHGPATVSAIVSSARAHGVLTIANEAFTGFGRLGTMFAVEQAEAIPDILCLSKALTGGFLPLSAAIASDEVFDTFAREDPAELMHGPSCPPNPLACAAACASLDLFDCEPRIEQARSMETRLRKGLRDCRTADGVSAVRIRGALAVVQLSSAVDGERLSRALVARGVWVRVTGGLLHLAPALNIADEELSDLCSAVGHVLKNRSLAVPYS